MADNEIYKIDNANLPSQRPAWYWEGIIDLGEDTMGAWARIAFLAKLIISYPSEKWPSDELWENLLPDWMKNQCPKMTRAEIECLLRKTPIDQQDDLPWEFGSWLEALRDRSWKWFGHELNGNTLHLVLEITDIPPRIAAFKQIIIAAGGEIKNEIWVPSP